MKIFNIMPRGVTIFWNSFTQDLPQVTGDAISRFAVNVLFSMKTVTTTSFRYLTAQILSRFSYYTSTKRNFSSDCPTQLKQAKEWIKQHRQEWGNPEDWELTFCTVFGIEPQNFVLTCGPKKTKEYHKVIGQLFTKEKSSAIRKITEDGARQLPADSLKNITLDNMKILCAQVFGYWLTGSLTHSQQLLALGFATDKLVRLSEGAVGEGEHSFGYVQKKYAAINEVLRVVANLDAAIFQPLLASGLNLGEAMSLVWIMITPACLSTGRVLHAAVQHCAGNPKLVAELVSELDTVEDPLKSPKLRALYAEALRVAHPDKQIRRRKARALSLEELRNSEELVGPHPEVFTAKRFEGSASEFLPSLPFLPFGHGAHMCPGWRFSRDLSLTALSVWLRRFS